MAISMAFACLARHITIATIRMIKATKSTPPITDPMMILKRLFASSSSSRAYFICASGCKSVWIMVGVWVWGWDVGGFI